MRQRTAWEMARKSGIDANGTPASNTYFSKSARRYEKSRQTIKREFGVKTGKWVHCAVYEDDLQRIWPPTEKDRRTKIAQFASNYGFD